jgi:hypothetical protein
MFRREVNLLLVTTNIPIFTFSFSFTLPQMKQEFLLESEPALAHAVLAD